MRKLSIILLATGLLLLAAACQDDNNGDGTTPTATGEATVEPTSEATPVETAEPTEEASNGDSSALFGSFNPFSALEGLSGAPSSGPVDPSLSDALLTATDLPGYLGLGEFSFNVPNPEGGTVDMAARMFMSGDIASGEFEAMVMSMAAEMPPGAQDDLGLDELAELSQEELDEITASAGQFGVAFNNISVLDASGLGESSGGIHMEMDFDALLGGLGAPGENPFADGIAMDMYMFVRGERMLMLMVMYPAGGSAGVDGHALAETMDGRT